MNEFIASYISEHLYTIWDYKMQMRPYPTLGAPNCIPSAFALIAYSTFPAHSPIIGTFKELVHLRVELLYAAPDVDGHHLRRLPEPINQPWSLSVNTLMKMGTQNLLDMGYYDQGLFAGEDGAVSYRCL